jgi:hypothetical protein
MAGRKNRGMLRMIAAGYSDDTGLEAIDRMIAEMMAFRLPGEEVDVLQPGDRSKVTARVWRLPRGEQPRCGARTRQGTLCKRQALNKGRCPNHGGLSTGPKSKAGRSRIAQAQRQRWQAYRLLKNNQTQIVG